MQRSTSIESVSRGKTKDLIVSLYNFNVLGFVGGHVKLNY